tara:strand:- start:772 stop:1299 length:528 start_codon:yes stop_codon:yes gene_type:complete
MKKYYLFLLVFLSLQSFGFKGALDLLEVRKLFYLASVSSPKSEQFLKEMLAVEDDSFGIRKGYLAMAYMLQAKYAWNPYNKLKFFMKGRDLLETQIKNHSTSTELIFLRYCIQTNAPFFLGYSSEIESDKNHIVEYYRTNLDDDLQWRIKKYFIDSKDLTKEEKKSLSKKLWTTM